MVPDGKSIAIVFVMQLAGVVLFVLGGPLGQHITDKLGVAHRVPLTASCVKLGLWPLVVPVLWAVVALKRSQREASSPEMLLWCALGVCVLLVIGGWGLMAAAAPLFAW